MSLQALWLWLLRVLTSLPMRMQQGSACCTSAWLLLPGVLCVCVTCNLLNM